MIKTLLAAGLLATGAAASAQVSVQIGQPGFYGRIDIGGYAPPQVLYAQPMIVERNVRTIEQQPVYLRVPPGHARNWAKHCHQYHACNEPVMFVRDSWYLNDYAPRVRARQVRERRHGGRGNSHDRPDGQGAFHGDGGRVGGLSVGREGDRDDGYGGDRYRNDGNRNAGNRDDDRKHGRGHEEHGNGKGKGHDKH